MFEEWYREFASQISYYDFREDESVELDLESQEREALTGLSNLDRLDTDSLSRLFTKSPALIYAIQKLFREQRFRNGQWIHFLFDIQMLNAPLNRRQVDHVVGTLRDDRGLRTLFDRSLKRSFPDEVERLESALEERKVDKMPRKSQATLLAVFKSVLVPYIGKPPLVMNRISDPTFPDVRDRLSSYLLTQLRLETFMDAVDPVKYMNWKRRPRDIRTLHGGYGQAKVREVFTAHHVPRMGSSDQSPPEASYLEQESLGDIHTRAGRLKVFDFVIYVKGKPVMAIETNFYESEGTKIEINVEEYIDVARNVTRKTGADFAWITDGPVWVSPGRKKTLKTLYENLNGHVYNYNTFSGALPMLLESLTT